MVQSLRLVVDCELSDAVLAEMAPRVSPAYLRGALRRRGIPNRRCPECGTATYDLAEPYQQIPTSDFTLRRDGNDLYGLASGAELADKLIVKAAALQRIKKLLEQRGIRSEIDFSDVARAEYALLEKYKLTV